VSFIFYKLINYSKLLFPYYSISVYDFPETYLGSKTLEKFRRKIYLYYIYNLLKKISNSELFKYYHDLKNCKELFINLIRLQSKIPRERFGGYPHPEIFYFLMRIIKPEIVIETGVSFGVTSAFMLQALEDNGFGKLYSIDLPLQFANKEEVGKLVPKRLKHRWELILGDAKIELPKLLEKLDYIDVFYHDSLHTYEHMIFEYENAWPKIRKGGYLISDDIHMNSAFIDFCKIHKLKPIFLSVNLGLINKNV